MSSFSYCSGYAIYVNMRTHTRTHTYHCLFAVRFFCRHGEASNDFGHKADGQHLECKTPEVSLRRPFSNPHYSHDEREGPAANMGVPQPPFNCDGSRTVPRPQQAWPLVHDGSGPQDCEARASKEHDDAGEKKPGESESSDGNTACESTLENNSSWTRSCAEQAHLASSGSADSAHTLRKNEEGEGPQQSGRPVPERRFAPNTLTPLLRLEIPPLLLNEDGHVVAGKVLHHSNPGGGRREGQRAHNAGGKNPLDVPGRSESSAFYNSLDDEEWIHVSWDCPRSTVYF